MTSIKSQTVNEEKRILYTLEKIWMVVGVGLEIDILTSMAHKVHVNFLLF